MRTALPTRTLNDYHPLLWVLTVGMVVGLATFLFGFHVGRHVERGNEVSTAIHELYDRMGITP